MGRFNQKTDSITGGNSNVDLAVARLLVDKDAQVTALAPDHGQDDLDEYVCTGAS